jgi:hypothetical protein
METDEISILRNIIDKTRIGHTKGKASDISAVSKK